MSTRRAGPPVTMLAYDGAASTTGWKIETDRSKRPEDGDRRPVLISWSDLQDLAYPTACPYCGTSLTQSTAGRWSSDSAGATYELSFCTFCAYWKFFAHRSWGWRGILHRELFVGKARTFRGALPSDIESEVASFLRRRPDAWAALEPAQLERYVAAIMKANNPDLDVKHVGQSHDGGVDVILVRDGAVETLVQVKRRSTSRSEPVETVRDLLGVMYYDRNLRGIVVSTAERFSRAARFEAERANMSAGGQTVIQLVDRGVLGELLSPLIPERPWRRLKADGTAFEEDGGARGAWAKLESGMADAIGRGG